MSAEGNSPAELDRHCEGMPHIFNQVSPSTARSSRTSSSSDCSYSSCDKSRSPSAEALRGRCRHRSRYSSSYSRSRSRPRCFRTSGRSRCHPNSSRSSHYGRQRRSRSSSPERYYGRSRRSRFSPSPVRRSYRSKSPGRCVRISQKGKMELPNVAKENAAAVIGVDGVELPSSVKCIEDQVKKTLETDTERRGKGEDVELSETSPVKKTINFSINNVVAKPSRSPVFHVQEVTSRADSVGNMLPYGRWIPVKKPSTKNC